jgi:hypothetical protein
MIHTVKTVRTLQAVAMTVGLAVLLWSTGIPSLFRSAEASSVTDASDTITTSKPSTVADHTIVFTTPNGLSIGQNLTLTFEGTFTMGTVGEDDIDILFNGVSSSTAAASANGVWGVDVTGSVITFDTPLDGGVPSSTVVTIRIGENAVDFGTGANQITNPSATTTSHKIDIGGTMQDSGQVRVAIVDEVLVTANVDTSLSFTVSGVTSGQAVNSSPTTTIAESTSVTLPFGTLPIGVSRVLAHDLAVSTNAKNGYTVTVEESTPLQTPTGATIDGFIDGSDTNTPTAWQGPAGLIADPDSWGHWGITSSDHATTSRVVEFSSDTWVAPSTTPIIVMGHDGVADGAAAGIGTARIGYQVQISALQEAGDDYSTTLRYIATPTF